jgi:uncharacterized protein (DUF3084 family)
VEAEFVNVYISKQKALIEDLLSKSVILETKLTMSENNAAKIKDELDSVLLQIEDKNNHINRLSNQVSNLNLAISQKEEIVTTKKKKETPAKQSIDADEF